MPATTPTQKKKVRKAAQANKLDDARPDAPDTEIEDDDYVNVKRWVDRFTSVTARIKRQACTCDHPDCRFDVLFMNKERYSSDRFDELTPFEKETALETLKAHRLVKHTQ